MDIGDGQEASDGFARLDQRNTRRSTGIADDELAVIDAQPNGNGRARQRPTELTSFGLKPLLREARLTPR